VAGKVEFVSSDVCLGIRRRYLEVIAKHCPQVLNILDRSHMVAKLNKAPDELIVVNHAGEARRMVREGYEPALKNKRWCLLKRPENLTDKQNVILQELLAYNLTSVRAFAERLSSSCSGNTTHRPGLPSSSMPGASGRCARASIR